MRKISLILTIAAAAGVTAACMAPPVVETSPEAATRIAEATHGRVAGTPVTCVSQRLLTNQRSLAPGVLAWDGRGGTIYVNRTRGDCPELRHPRAIQFRTTSLNLCAGDVGQVFDPYTNILGGHCTLGMFEPYTAR